MKYVILDLEWNTAYYRKEQRFINEIIEFGAVKVDEKMRVVDSFQMFVKSRVSKKLRGSVKNLTHISNEQLQQDGKDFAAVVSKFTRFCGKNTLLLTWSNTDLYTLMDNCRSFLGEERIPFLHRYADLQKYVQSRLQRSGGNQLGLSAAAEAFAVPTQDIDLHRAAGDALLSARVLKQCYDKAALLHLSMDCDAPDFYQRFFFKPYPITDLKDPSVEPEDLVFTCLRCNGTLKRRRGFQKKNRGFESSFVCPVCQRYYTGHVQIMKLYDSVSVKRTITEAEPGEERKKRRRRRPRKPAAETVSTEA